MKDTNVIIESSNKTDETKSHPLSESSDYDEDLILPISKITLGCVIILTLMSFLFYFKYLSFGLSGFFYFWIVPCILIILCCVLYFKNLRFYPQIVLIILVLASIFSGWYYCQAPNDSSYVGEFTLFEHKGISDWSGDPYVWGYSYINDSDENNIFSPVSLFMIIGYIMLLIHVGLLYLNDKHMKSHKHRDSRSPFAISSIILITGVLSILTFIMAIGYFSYNILSLYWFDGGNLFYSYTTDYDGSIAFTHTLGIGWYTTVFCVLILLITNVQYFTQLLTNKKKESL